MNKVQATITTGGGMLVIVLMLCNFLNFVFNAYLGRVLSFEEYGLVTFVSTLGYILSIFISGLGAVVNHRVSFLTANSRVAGGMSFYKTTRLRAFFIALILSTLWFISNSFIASFFHIKENLAIVLFTPVILFSAFSATGKGFLQANLRFGSIAWITFIETLSKLTVAFAFVLIGLNDWAYLSIPVSFFITFAITIWFAFKHSPEVEKESTDTDYSFPFSFYFASMLSGLATTAFLSIDVLLAKHYLAPDAAGQYAVLSLVGKMVFFFGSLFNTFMITFISRDLGAKRSTGATFYKLFAACAVFSFFAFTLLGPLGHVFVPFLLGSKSMAIVPFLTIYSLGILFFTLSNIIVSYRLVRHEYIFPVVSMCAAILLTITVSFRHSGPGQIAEMVLLSGFISFSVISIMHVMFDHGRYIFRNLIDLVDLFIPLDPDTVPGSSGAGKKILVLNWRDIRHKHAGGAEVYVHELARRWVQKGNHVTVFCGSDGMSPRYELVDGVEIIRRGGFYMVYIWAFLYYLIRFRKRYDVIVDCENGIPFFSPLYTKEKQFLLIHHVHRDVFRKSLRPPFSQIATFLETKVMPYAYDNVKIITVSPSSQKEILEEKLTKDIVSVIYNGVDLEQFTPGVKDSDPVVLYLGRLKKYKSVDVLIRAAQQVLSAVPNARFIIAGDGEERGRLVKLADQLGLAGSIEFLGKVSEEVKVELYRRATVFVNPSYMEGWGITTIEANACGTPVVASRVSGLIDSVKNPHTGYLVTYGDHDEFASKITELLTNKKQWTRMSEASIVWANEFDWNKSADKALEVFFPYE
ncbi:MAG: glycosyltransferase [bacterium]|nr:glycosyltransferase [bacterium]